MDPDRAVADDIESTAPAPPQGTMQAYSRPATSSRDGEPKQAFYQMMNDWFTQYIRTNSTIQQPSPPVNLPQAPVMPPVNPTQLNRPPVDKIRKYGVEEFRATTNDDAERSEFGLENTIRVFDEMSLNLEEYVKCVVSLLRDTTYHWWKTLISMVPSERVIWDFF